MATPAPLNVLRVFEAVVRTGSFRAAADELFVTQSAISHQIRSLEDWFGGPLFIRDGNRLRPLRHAKELARSLSLSFDTIHTACRQARGSGTHRPLVVAAIPSVAVCWLIPRLGRFRDEHPDIDIRIVYALHGQEIDFGDVHFAFVFARTAPTPSSAGVHRFLPGASVPVCSPGLAASIAGGDPARAIPRMDLLHDTDHAGWQTWFARAGLHDPPAEGGPVFEDFNLLRAAALSGQGVALCPEAMIRPDLEAGHLVRLSQTTVFEDCGYYLLQGPLAAATRANADAFRSWVLDERDRDQGEPDPTAA
ncbi:LysR substrate-binding domain-containing protein [Paracoccus sp. MC1862]|uniref:LysR substrate-binding domain-containing protein n=1 Tax=Paracoccus sp. MC1862 TaxID=2760307 RepID=UPI001601CB41|nr:LysR substrate-binding domain-containing protein [Paracoccus sp. MC1862]MBB1498260.1 LysR family transcriptional regulator [Paracoccus sp. MC1862]QQO44971.1 LysR family transcriptional regulator [Paracoccus sp. MC1862]